MQIDNSCGVHSEWFFCIDTVTAVDADGVEKLGSTWIDTSEVNRRAHADWSKNLAKILACLQVQNGRINQMLQILRSITGDDTDNEFR